MEPHFPPRVLSKSLKDDGTFPNNVLPVILYQQILFGEDLATEFEAIFENNNWKNSWRNGIFDYHHYHSNSHEVLGIYSGFAKLQLGGFAGIIHQVSAGDVVIIPAGVAHKNLQHSPDFKCVGAYPDGSDYDIQYGKEGERPQADENIRSVPIPDLDPVFGKIGPLITLWKKSI